MKRPSRNGFSLVEVVVALGLLGSVLIAISGIFVLGNRLVKSGRTQSTALSVGHHIMEELGGWSYDELRDTLGLSGTAASETVDTRTNGYGAKWQAELSAELFEAYALIDVEAVTDVGSPPPLDSAEAVRITVEVHWSEGPRARSVELVTVMM